MTLDKKQFLRDLGQKIQNARNQLGMTQETLAEKTGLSSTYISKIEQGHVNFSAYTMVQLCEILEFDVPQIFSKNCNMKYRWQCTDICDMLQRNSSDEIESIQQIIQIINDMLNKSNT